MNFVKPLSHVPLSFFSVTILNTHGRCLKCEFRFSYIFITCQMHGYYASCPSIPAQKVPPKAKKKKTVNEVDVRDGKWLVHWSTFFTRSTTGTEVHGIIPRSVITRSTKSGGVTSYARLRRPSEDTSCQRSKCVFPARLTIRSSGSSEGK